MARYKTKELPELQAQGNRRECEHPGATLLTFISSETPDELECQKPAEVPKGLRE
jgi:hypothetical protein